MELVIKMLWLKLVFLGNQKPYILGIIQRKLKVKSKILQAQKFETISDISQMNWYNVNYLTILGFDVNYYNILDMSL